MIDLFRLTSFRIIFIYIILLALSIGLVAFYLYWSTSRDFQMKVDNEIIQESTRLSQVYKRYKQEQDKIEREKPDIKPTKDEVINTSISLLKTEYEDYLVDPDVYRDSEFRYTQYKFIYKK